jgi:anti-sigma regulatory factor (Ser/Thr protein kinase)
VDVDESYDAATWLPRERRSAPAAREFVKHTLTKWTGTLAPVAHTAELLACELVTNALQHARSDIRLRLRCDGKRLRVEVADGSRWPPLKRHTYAAETVGGHGLLLVEELADDWGVDRRPAGKVVWCEISV